jgi:putative RecB family exonuclease
LLFRFRTIDKLPEQPSADQVRGTLVHAVLERLFDLPAAERTPEAAAELVAPEWARLVEHEPQLAELFAEVPVAELADPQIHLTSTATGSPAGSSDGSPAGSPDAEQSMLDGMPADETARLAVFLRGARSLLQGYFAVEDPRRLEPAEREALVSTLVDDELLIRGYIDRLDVSPAGDLRVVDYKTGGAPREAFEGRALFQLKFYALVLWRTRGVVPKVLRLLYLKDAEVCDYSPDAEELERFERTLIALSQAVERAKRDRDFRPKPSRLCGWCNHQRFCPAYGGTPPPYPEPAAPGASADPGQTSASLPAGELAPGQGASPAAVPAPDQAASLAAVPAPSQPASATAAPTPGHAASPFPASAPAPGQAASLAAAPQPVGEAAPDQTSTQATTPRAGGEPAAGHTASLPALGGPAVGTSPDGADRLG